jgi:hypothetical protein
VEGCAGKTAIKGDTLARVSPEIDLRYLSDDQIARITAVTISAPNKMTEHVIQLDKSPFSLTCRIACLLLSVAG